MTLLTLAGLLLLSLPLSALARQGGAEPITIDDLLRAESPGNAWFSPDGAEVVYGRQLGISAMPSWGYDSASLVRQELRVAMRDGRQRPIVASDQVRYALPVANPWSPDGEGLLLLTARRDSLGLGYWHAADGKVVELEGRPFQQFVVFDWIEDELVFASIPEGGRQRGVRRQVLDTVERRWVGAWEDDGPQVTISSANDVFDSSVPASGALMLADLGTGKSQRVAEGEYAAVSVSPDARHVAAIRLVEPIVGGYHWQGGRGELQMFERTTQGLILRWHVDDLDVSYDRLVWSPDSRRLLAIGNEVGVEHAKARLLDIDAASGLRHEIAADGFSFVGPGMEHMGKVLQIGWLGDVPMAIVARCGVLATKAETQVERKFDYGEDRGVRFDLRLFGPRGPEYLTAFAKGSTKNFVASGDGRSALAIVDGALWRLASGSRPERLTAAEAGTVFAFGTDAKYPPSDPATAYHRDGNGERISLQVLDDKGKPKRHVLDIGSGRLNRTDSTGKIVATSPDQLVTLSYASEGWSTSLRFDGGDVLTTFNENLKGRQAAGVRAFRYAFKGRELTGWVVVPDNASGPLPAIASVYGGLVHGAQPPRQALTSVYSPIFSGQLLAAHGYAVIYPSTPLGAGSETDVMADLAAAVIAAVDALAAEGVVDPERVGVTGQSFGGFSTAAILARRSDRFRAGVATAGIYDWLGSYGIKALEYTLSDDGRNTADESKMIETGQIRLGRPFWEDPQPYIRNSPIFHVDDIDSPLLIIQGDLDMGVTGITGAERMYNALVRAGKQPTLARYWGEGHVAMSEAAIRDQWMRITTWFDTYVKPVR